MGSKAEAASTGHCLVAYGYMALWVALSATVIMFNKYILAPDLGGFPFPLTLTGVHMVFCSAVSWLLVKAKLVEVQDMPVETYARYVVPIGVLFAVTLWMGNAAYLHLSVSFIQMVKALMPMLVYAVGVALGTEQWSRRTGSILAVVVGGVLLASYGEVVFVLLGVLFQGASLLSEATRLTLVQLLLQQKGFKLNPISTMYHISPVCFMALLIPLATLEAEKVMKHDWKIGPGMLLCSAAAAFALNCAVFLLVGKTSALTINIAGVVKDVMLVYLSVTVYGSHTTPAQVAGYAVALCGVFAYNYSKMHKPWPSTNRLSISGRLSTPSRVSAPGGRLSVSGSNSKPNGGRHPDQAQPHDRHCIPCNSGVSTARASAQVVRDRRVSSASVDCSVAVAVNHQQQQVEPAKPVLGASDSMGDSMQGMGMWGASGGSSLRLSNRVATAEKCR